MRWYIKLNISFSGNLKKSGSRYECKEGECEYNYQKGKKVCDSEEKLLYVYN